MAEGRTYRQNFPEGRGRIELNSRVQALDADHEAGQLVQLAKGEDRKARKREKGKGGRVRTKTNAAERRRRKRLWRNKKRNGCRSRENIVKSC